MFKTFIFPLCITLGCVFFVENVRCDKCRRAVPLEPATSCGPQQTMYNEGECLCCYKDIMNIPTIGIGFNLRRADAAQVMSKYNLTLSDVLLDCIDKTTKHCLTDADAKEIFNTISYPEFGPCVDIYAPGLPPVKRAAIIDVAFISCKKLGNFTEMQKALNKQDWETAAEELRNSHWCQQVGPSRCNSDVTCIAGCTGQTCGSYTFNCSSNPNCLCYKTLNGSGFCAVDTLCGADCTDCSPLTSVCIVDTCCPTPQCVPLSLGETCINPPTRARARSKILHKFFDLLTTLTLCSKDRLSLHSNVFKCNKT